MQRLDNTTITTEAKYYFNFTKSKNVLSLHCNRSNSFLYVNGLKTYRFKAKDSEIKPYSLCLCNTPEDFTVDSMKITGLNGCVYDFAVDYNTTDVSDTGDIHNCLMKKHNIK